MNSRLMLAVLASATLALTSCTSTDSTNTPRAGSAGTNIDGLRLGNFLDLTSWDPAQSDIGFESVYLSAVYDPLIALTPSGKPRPALATHWTLSRDHRRLALTLRRGVTFSDGSPFDAAAAAANLEHLRTGTASAPTYAAVDSITTKGTNTVVLHLTHPDNALLYFMGLGRSYMVSPNALNKPSLAQHPVGSGPYLLSDRSRPGAEYDFSRRPHYWDSAAYPFKTVTIMPIVDFTARNNAMLSGQINAEYTDDTGYVEAKRQGWNIAQKASNWVGLQITDHEGIRVKALADTRVRRAINYAFDGPAILKSIGKNHGSPASQVFPVGSPAYIASLNTTYSYNVTKAKSLMAAAGYPNGFTVTMPMTPILQRYQAVTEQSLNAIGIRIKWINMSQADFQTKASNYPMFNAVLAMHNQPAATVQAQLTSPMWYNNSPTYTSHQDLKALVDRMNASNSENGSLSAARELNRELVKDAWFDVWYQSTNIYVSLPGIKITPVRGMMFPTLRYITKN